MSDNLYDILGVSKDASEAEIKKAYKKAALKYHPDRQAGKSDAEKKEAEEMFKKVSHAHEVLTDPQKKQNYDTFGDENGGMQGGNPFSGFGGFGGFNPFEDFNPFGGFGGGHRKSRPTVQPGRDIQMKIPVSIEDIFNGCKHSVKYTKQVRCASCHGAGGTGQKACPKCHGTGRIIQQTSFGGGISITESECPLCHGTGLYVEHKCDRCGGSGFEKKEVKLDVEFIPGIQNGEYKIYENQGSESKQTSGPNGKFIAIPVYTFDTDKYIVEGLNVIENIYIPYYKLLLGCSYTVNIPNGTSKKIKVQSCIKEGTMIRLSHEGLKRPDGQVGDYYVCVHYQIPESLTEKELEHLSAINTENDK